MLLRNLLLLGVLCSLCSFAEAAAPHALPEGKLPNDARLGPPKDLNGYFPLAVPKDVAEWNNRAAAVRRQMLVSLGLWPMPNKTPRNAVIHSRIDRPEYTVEKVYFESYPGFFVTGSLYRPKNTQGKIPGVLVPYGHHANGRFNEETKKFAEYRIAEGAERFVSGGRYPLQAMCVTLARMGCVAFQYDMVGYADSIQLPYSLAHGYDGESSSVKGPRPAGFFSAQAELQLQNIMGLQTYNSMCSLDFLLDLPEVDSARIGVTGASGGGTQTFILGALDPRVTATMPVVMVSTGMQGGCTCENAAYMRIGTGNVEFAALFAPKPQCFVAADDWTREFGSKGFPELQSLYQLLGAPKNVSAALNVQFPHNYNFVSREVMYQWFNKHLKLGLESPVLEESFEPIPIAELSVWDKDHPKPPSGDAFEAELCKRIAEDSANQIAKLAEQGSSADTEYRRVVGGAFEVILGGGLPAKEDVDTKFEIIPGPKYITKTGLLHRKSLGSEVPVVLLNPKNDEPKRYVLWLDAAGKSGLFGEDGLARPEVQNLINAQCGVIGVDLFQQGEFTKSGESPAEIHRVREARQALAYTLGYNYPVVSQRVRDILSVAANFQSKDKPLDLVATNGDGHLAAAALAVAGNLFDKAAIDTAGFRFAKLNSVWSIDMLPGAVKYGDLPGMLSLAQVKELWLASEESKPDNRPAATIDDGPKEERTEAAVSWLLKN